MDILLGVASLCARVVLDRVKTSDISSRLDELISECRCGNEERQRMIGEIEHNRRLLESVIGECISKGIWEEDAISRRVMDELSSSSPRLERSFLWMEGLSV